MIIQRCIYIEGIGRVHALGPIDGPPVEFAPMDVEVTDLREAMRLGSLAADILGGDGPGRVLWSVRFTEKGSS